MVFENSKTLKSIKRAQVLLKCYSCVKVSSTALSFSTGRVRVRSLSYLLTVQFTSYEK